LPLEAYYIDHEWNYFVGRWELTFAAGTHKLSGRGRSVFRGGTLATPLWLKFASRYKTLPMTYSSIFVCWDWLRFRRPAAVLLELIFVLA
jgi:hypothetical protein